MPKQRTISRQQRNKSRNVQPAAHERSSESKTRARKPNISGALLGKLPEAIGSITSLLEGENLPPDELQETEGWLDWGIKLLEEWGPTVLETVPELLALL